jgi:hypothetical protein
MSTTGNKPWDLPEAQAKARAQAAEQPKANGAVHDVPTPVPDAPLVQSAAGKLHPLPEALEPLLSLRQWVCWRYKKKDDGTYTKPPFQTNGTFAENNDPKTWTTFEAAALAAKRFDGVGFVLKNTEIAAFDLDHCRDAKTGIIEPWAAALADKARSYAEITPSGTGLRIIGYGSGDEVHRKLPVPNANGTSCELYRKATRYITVTGVVYRDAPLANIDTVIDAVLAELETKPKAATKADDAGSERTLPPSLVSLLHLPNLGASVPHGGYKDRSALLFAFLTGAARARVVDKAIAAACLDPTHTSRAIFEHIKDNGGRAYVERQIEKAHAKVGEAAGEAASQKATKPTIPVDLWGKFNPPPLPTDLLPLVIEQYAIAQAHMMGCDAGGLAMATLTVCAAAISDRIELQMKRHDPYWKEAARIWTALVGLPSTKKSPIMRQAARGLVRLDIELHRDYMQAMAEYEALPAEEKKTTRPPRQKRLRIEDTTIEAAQVVLMDSPDGVLCLQDELSGWFGAMDKYGTARGAAKDRGFWMQAFNGGSYAVNRVIRGAGIIENVSVSMLGGIQPEPMRKLVADSHDDGLIQRLFPIVLKPATMGKDEPQLGVVGACDDLIDRLHTLQPPTNRGSGNLAGYLPSVLRFDDAAQEFRGRLEQKHINLQACEAINKKLAAHIGKYDGLFGRLCVVWHCIENIDAPYLPDLITADTGRRVAKFLHEYLLPHAIAFYTEILGLSDEHERLTAVAGYILARKLERVTNRDVAHGDRTMRRLTKRDIDAVFEQLDALGWVERIPAPRPSDPPHWTVNPEVHQRFCARGEAEAKRRAEARKAILAAIGASRANGDTDE